MARGYCRVWTYKQWIMSEVFQEDSLRENRVAGGSQGDGEEMKSNDAGEVYDRSYLSIADSVLIFPDVQHALLPCRFNLLLCSEMFS